MMNFMRYFGLFLLCAACWGGEAASAADLTAVHTVYIMGMAHGLDQYLANRLTNQHVYRVVTDPKLADAVMTDHIGRAFEEQLADLIPPPEEPKKDKPAEAKPDAKAESKKGASDARPPIMLVDPENKLPNLALNSTFGRNKGTLFLVDPKSRQVLWSVYEEPASGDSKQLDRTASDIVSRLKKDLTGQKEKR
jgi:hypothetical protein